MTSEGLKNGLMDSAVILACITAFLYAASTAFTHGYFLYLGLDSDVLYRNFHQIIYHGMVINIVNLMKIPLFAAAVVTILYLYKIGLSEYRHKGFNRGRKLVRLKKKIGLRTKKDRPVIRRYFLIIIKVWVIVVLVLFVMYKLADFEGQGQNEAKSVMGRIVNGEFDKVDLKAQGMGSGFAFLYCGSQNCAAFDIKKKTIIYFPQNGYSFTRFEKE